MRNPLYHWTHLELKTAFGEERLLRSLNETPEQTVEERCMKVKDDVAAFVADEPQFDDMTMLCVQLSRVNAGETLEIQPDAKAGQRYAGDPPRRGRGQRGGAGEQRHVRVHTGTFPGQRWSDKLTPHFVRAQLYVRCPYIALSEGHCVVPEVIRQAR